MAYGGHADRAVPARAVAGAPGEGLTCMRAGIGPTAVSANLAALCHGIARSGAGGHNAWRGLAPRARRLAGLPWPCFLMALVPIPGRTEYPMRREGENSARPVRGW